MKARICAVTIFMILAGASPSLSYLGEVVDSYASPAETYNGGVGVSNNDIYVSRRYSPIMIYRCNINNGSVLDSWPPPVNNKVVYGIAYVPRGHCWCNRQTEKIFYCCDYTTGSITRSWTVSDLAYGLAPFCTGDGGAGTTRLLANYINPNRVCAHNLGDGTVTDIVDLSVCARWDIAYDWRNNMVWGLNSAGNQINGYSYDTGSVVASFQAPSPSTKGLAYTGSHLYAASDISGLIYKIHCPGDIGVAPASVGRVKALFF